ncbi:hypothetical protein [Cedecea davisae]|uniref:hypothetical protein n=1 Tax=Cedecea davisae TaxID=158484 RepID=UPI001D0BBDB3|nr:hypothetical protein [Cedecea davisae]
MFFNAKQHSVNLLTPDLAEVIIEESVFAYTKDIGNKQVVVMFPGAIIHDVFNSHADALEEIARIWLLIRDAERKISLLFREANGKCFIAPTALKH